jgi:hypothetical protein
MSKAGNGMVRIQGEHLKHTFLHAAKRIWRTFRYAKGFNLADDDLSIQG